MLWFGLIQVFVFRLTSHPEFPSFHQCVTRSFLQPNPQGELFYNVFHVSIIYFIPLIIIIYTYTMILWKIHRKSKQQSQSGKFSSYTFTCKSQEKNMKEKMNESLIYQRVIPFLKQYIIYLSSSSIIGI